jgi:hypothetical protein
MSVYQRQESPYWYYQFKIRKQRYRGPTKEPERGLAEADERAMRQNINDESGLTTPPMNEVLKRYLIAMGERIMQGQEAILNRVAALEHDVKALRCDFDALKDELRKEDGDQVDRIAGGTLESVGGRQITEQTSHRVPGYHRSVSALRSGRPPSLR